MADPSFVLLICETSPNSCSSPPSALRAFPNEKSPQFSPRTMTLVPVSSGKKDWTPFFLKASRTLSRISGTSARSVVIKILESQEGALASKSEGKAVPAPSSRMTLGFSFVPVKKSSRWWTYSARTSDDGQT